MAGLPKPEKPNVLERVSGLSVDELGKLTGLDILRLKKWKDETMAEMEKELLIKFEAEYQKRLSAAENEIIVITLMTVLSSLEGYHWARSASNWIVEHYDTISEKISTKNLKEIYDYIHEKWGVEFEFTEDESNSLIRDDIVDWREEYFKGLKLPTPVMDMIYEGIWDDATAAVAYMSQLSVLWEICEDFGFHKKKGMMERFYNGLSEKFSAIQRNDPKPSEVEEMLVKKYNFSFEWKNSTCRVKEKLDL